MKIGVRQQAIGNRELILDFGIEKAMNEETAKAPILDFRPESKQKSKIEDRCRT